MSYTHCGIGGPLGTTPDMSFVSIVAFHWYMHNNTSSVIPSTTLDMFDVAMQHLFRSDSSRVFVHDSSIFLYWTFCMPCRSSICALISCLRCWSSESLCCFSPSSLRILLNCPFYILANTISPNSRTDDDQTPKSKLNWPTTGLLSL